jgi:hypothetical protein
MLKRTKTAAAMALIATLGAFAVSSTTMAATEEGERGDRPRNAITALPAGERQKAEALARTIADIMEDSAGKTYSQIAALIETAIAQSGANPAQAQAAISVETARQEKAHHATELAALAIARNAVVLAATADVAAGGGSAGASAFSSSLAATSASGGGTDYTPH